ncbi:hypothetical protein HJFPF1_12943 [Paramyrothecium foliicola]|nr:hypothetical protein HJFPF1_12943 [Paramyrothecium foliicola]
MKRENTFLADKRWLTVPFSQSGTAPLQNLFRELSSLSSTLNEVDELLKTPSTSSFASACLLFPKFGQFLDSLLDLEETVKNGDGDVDWLPLYPLQTGTNIWFPNITSANFFTHLWALRILCIYRMTQLVSRFPSLGAQIMPRHQAAISVDMVVHLSSLILRSMDFLVSDEFKLSGAASTIMPLYVVRDFIKKEGTRNDELYAWQQRVVQTLRSMGYEFLIEQTIES